MFAFKLVPADILRAYSDSARVSMIIWSRWLGGYSRLIYILGWFVLGEPTSARSTRQYQDKFCTESFGMRWNSWYEHLHLYVCSFLIWSFFSYFGHLWHACFLCSKYCCFHFKKYFTDSILVVCIALHRRRLLRLCSLMTLQTWIEQRLCQHSQHGIKHKVIMLATLSSLSTLLTECLSM